MGYELQGSRVRWRRRASGAKPASRDIILGPARTGESIARIHADVTAGCLADYTPAPPAFFE